MYCVEERQKGERTPAVLRTYRTNQHKHRILRAQTTIFNEYYDPLVAHRSSVRPYPVQRKGKSRQAEGKQYQDHMHRTSNIESQYYPSKEYIPPPCPYSYGVGQNSRDTGDRYEYRYEPGVSGSLCIISFPVHCHCMVHPDGLPADHPIHPEALNPAPETSQNHPGACTAHTSPVYCYTIRHGTVLHRPPPQTDKNGHTTCIFLTIPVP